MELGTRIPPNMGVEHCHVCWPHCGRGHLDQKEKPQVGEINSHCMMLFVFLTCTICCFLDFFTNWHPNTYIHLKRL